MIIKNINFEYNKDADCFKIGPDNSLSLRQAGYFIDWIKGNWNYCGVNYLNFTNELLFPPPSLTWKNNGAKIKLSNSEVFLNKLDLLQLRKFINGKLAE